MHVQRNAAASGLRPLPRARDFQVPAPALHGLPVQNVRAAAGVFPNAFLFKQAQVVATRSIT